MAAISEKSSKFARNKNLKEYLYVIIYCRQDCYGRIDF